jgi:hypothetical protein
MSLHANRAALIREGFTIAGGMWGEAAWVQPRPDVVVAINDSRQGLDGRHPEEGWIIWTYRAPFMPGWTLDTGEAPIDDPGQGEMESAPDMPAAIERVREIIAAL